MKTKLNLAMFIVPIFLLSFLNNFVFEKPTISEIENRSLKAKPIFTYERLFNGDYFKDYEEYYADNFIFREEFVKISRDIKSLYGIEQANTATIINQRPNFVAQEDPGKKEGKTEAKGNKSSGEFVGGMLLLEDRALYLHHFNTEAADHYAAVINNFVEKAAGKVKVYSVLAPTQVEFLNNQVSQEMSDSEKKTINYVYSKLDQNVTPVNAYDQLKRHSKDYLYFRTDHHWTALGAYYAYVGFMKSMGEQPVSLEKYKETKIKNFLGTAHSATLSKNLEKNPDTISLYQPFVKHQYQAVNETGNLVPMTVLDMSKSEDKNKYLIFISGDRPWGKITTEVKNGRKLLVIKDSYANAFVPFLIPHFEEIYIVDPRGFKGDIYAFIEQNQINQVLFFNNADVPCYQDFTGILENLVKQK